MDKLENFKTSIVGSFGEGSFLLLVEVGGNSDDRRVDLFASEVGSRLRQAPQLTGRYLGNGNS